MHRLLLPLSAVLLLAGATWPGGRWAQEPWPSLGSFPGYSIESPSLDHLACSDTLGCNDPNGNLLIDRARFSAITSGCRDADGTPNNAASDCISTDRTFQFTNNGAVLAGDLSVNIFKGAEEQEIDEQFCRCNGGSFGVCSVDADCTASSCVDILSADSLDYQQRELTAEVTDHYGVGNHSYEAVAYNAYAGCNASSSILTLAYAPRRDIPDGSNWGIAWYDNLHHGPIHGRFAGEAMLEAVEEMHFTPVENLVDNGYMESSCNTTDWNKGKDDVGDPDIVAMVQTHIPDNHHKDYVVGSLLAATNFNSSYRGKSCQLSAGGGAGFDRQWIESNTITVETGRYYSVDTMIRVGGFLTPTSDHFGVLVIDTSTGNPVTQRWWNCKGICVEVTDQNVNYPGIQFRREDFYSWTPYVGEFVAPASGTVRVRFAMSAAANLDRFDVDEVEAHASIDNADGLRPIFGNWTPTTLRLGYNGDSSADECATAAHWNSNGAQGGDDVPCGMDVAHDFGAGSGLTFSAAIYKDSTVGHGGRSYRRFRDDANEGSTVFANTTDIEPTGWSTFLAKAEDPCLLGDGAGGACNDTRFDAIILEFAYNDLRSVDNYTDDLLASVVFADRVAGCEIPKAAGIRCILTTESAIDGNGALPAAGAGSCTDDGVTENNYNCASAIKDYNALLVRGDGLGGSKGAGW